MLVPLLLCALQNPIVVQRNEILWVPIPYDAPGAAVHWGPADRKADHGTVAFNDRGDLLIAYHADASHVASGLKQVEAALLLRTGPETWTYAASYLVGSTEYNPLQRQNITYVKCERPDVIGIGDHFAVAWTRRYETKTNHPAVWNWPSSTTTLPPARSPTWSATPPCRVVLRTAKGSSWMRMILCWDTPFSSRSAPAWRTWWP